MVECRVVPFTSFFGVPVLALCKRFAAEAPVYNELEFDQEGTTAFLANYLPPHDHKIGFVAKVDENIVGFILASVYKHPCLNGLLSADDLMYVHPDYRKMGIGKVIGEAYTEWAKERARVVLLGSSSGIPADKGEKFYASLGYSPCGLLAKLGG